MNPHYRLVAGRAGHRCEYCRAPEVIFNFPFEIEHVLPTSQQGPDDESNLALACRSCNLFKAAQTTGTEATAGSEVRLFHPRQDRWEEHFQVNPQTGEVMGLTPVGRATVLCLRMNSAPRMEARQLWIRLGLYP
jgi:hypothetical protein